ncbi:MAG: NifU family protein [Actinomycetota bacterium]|nr:NifU family protein [Actinomycetota bacterium]
MAAPSDLRSLGERIEGLLDASAAGGPAARERAEELVRLVVELYGSGLERVLEIVHDAGALDDRLLDRLTDDDLVASLLLVHGLHPYAVEERVARALEKVRPYLGSHGGDVELIDVTEEGVVQLRMLGSCDGCPSSSVTLKLAVEGAIEAAAPEIVRIEVDTPTANSTAPVGGFIPVTALTSRLRAGDAGGDSTPAWTPLEGLEDLTAGGIRQVQVGEITAVVCRIGSELYAYRDRCPACGSSLAAAVVERALGAARGSAILTCPGCRGHYDVVQAGRGMGESTPDHLEPLPLLVRDGVVNVAVASPVPA